MWVVLRILSVKLGRTCRVSLLSRVYVSWILRVIMRLIISLLLLVNRWMRKTLIHPIQILWVSHKVILSLNILNPTLINWSILILIIKILSWNIGRNSSGIYCYWITSPIYLTVSFILILLRSKTLRKSTIIIKLIRTRWHIHITVLIIKTSI